MGFLDIANLIANIGFPAALVVFFVIWSQRRENLLADRLNGLEAEYRENLLTRIRDNDKVILQHTNIMCDLVEAVRESNRQVSVLLIRMGERPCLLKSFSAGCQDEQIKA